MTEFNTHYMRTHVARMRQGETTAGDDLLRPAMQRLEFLARKMLRSYPTVRRWEDESDILQQALLRFLRALEQVEPANTREFFALASTQIRRELIDLARHYQGPLGDGQNLQDGGEDADPLRGEAARSDDDLDRWVALHQAVERLPVEEREVFMLSFYHDWTQPRIAELFGVTERTVRRWYLEAVSRLREQLVNLPPDRG